MTATLGRSSVACLLVLLTRSAPGQEPRDFRPDAPASEVRREATADSLPPLATPPASAAPTVPVAPAAVPSEPPCPTCPDGESKPPENPFKKIPPSTPVPRLGSFLVPPDPPNYYSFFDLLEGNRREAPPKFPLGSFGLFGQSTFDWDFRYLDDPKNQQVDFFDPIKRVRVGDDFLFSTGGEFRYRHMSETGSRLTGRNNNYENVRVRNYGDLWYKDDYRVFVEFIYAESYNQNLPPLPIDDTNFDLLNAFVEAKVTEIGGDPVQVRVGRQELLYGSQRLISSLDWANTRRTFQGAKVYWHTKEWDVDFFWTQPVVSDPDSFDSNDNNRDFSGVWLTHKPRPGTTFDLYFLHLNDTRSSVRARTSSFGARYAGDVDKRFLFDFEGVQQFGERNGEDINAHAVTAGLGYRATKLPWNPQGWVYYDYASGDPSRQGETSTSFRTFNQLFPFGHYYFGFLDQVGRQNIHDLNFQGSVHPQAWLTLLTQLHFFRLDSRRDALFNAAGVPIRRDPTGRAGNDVGTEFDFLGNVHIDMHQDLLFGYSKLYAGDFIKRTGSPRSPDLFYVQYTYRY